MESISSQSMLWIFSGIYLSIQSIFSNMELIFFPNSEKNFDRNLSKNFDKNLSKNFSRNFELNSSLWLTFFLMPVNPWMISILISVFWDLLLLSFLNIELIFFFLVFMLMIFLIWLIQNMIFLMDFAEGEQGKFFEIYLLLFFMFFWIFLNE